MLTLVAPQAETLWDEVLPIEARDDQRGEGQHPADARSGQ